MVRGLTIDKQRGNVGLILLLYVTLQSVHAPTLRRQTRLINQAACHWIQVLKIDRHKYVKIAYHGFKPMSREDRLNTYSNSDVRLDMRARRHRLCMDVHACKGVACCVLLQVVWADATCPV
jgi:5' nucleotidase family